MHDLLLKDVILGILAFAGVFGVLTGYGFIKGIPIQFRILTVVVVAIWFVSIAAVGVLYVHDGTKEQVSDSAFSYVGRLFLLAFAWLGIYVIMKPICEFAEKAANRLDTRGDSEDD